MSVCAGLWFLTWWPSCPKSQPSTDICIISTIIQQKPRFYLLLTKPATTVTTNLILYKFCKREALFSVREICDAASLNEYKREMEQKHMTSFVQTGCVQIFLFLSCNRSDISASKRCSTSHKHDSILCLTGHISTKCFWSHNCRKLQTRLQNENDDKHVMIILALNKAKKQHLEKFWHNMHYAQYALPKT